MSQVKCPDCGSIFDNSLGACPDCGCPVNFCSTLTTGIGNADNGKQSYYYVDFSWFTRFSSDPWLLNKLLESDFLKWLFAPWHIGGYPEDYEEEETLDNDHLIANDLFFIWNRSWKLFVYPQVWTGIKLLPLTLLYIILIVIVAASTHSDDIIGTVLSLGGIVYLVFMIWFTFIAIGKSYKRYFLPMIGAIRHCSIVFVKNIKDNI